MCVYIRGLSPCTTHGFHIHAGNDTTTDGKFRDSGFEFTSFTLFGVWILAEKFHSDD